MTGFWKENLCIVFALLDLDDCIEEGIPYTGNLSVSRSGYTCLPWLEVIEDTDVLPYGLAEFPDENWEQLANHCRYRQLM